MNEPPEGTQKWADYGYAVGDADDEWEAFLQRAAQHSQSGKRSTNIQSRFSGELSGAWRLLDDNSELEAFELEPFMESSLNRCWPLYRVKCRVRFFINIDLSC